MAEKLGNILSVHGIAPATLQRTVVVAALSFLFFLVTMVMFSMWKNFLYFFMSTAFLIVYALTMFGWLRLRKNTLTIYENGIKYRKFTAQWNEIDTVKRVDDGGATFELTKSNGEKIALSDTFFEIEEAVAIIASKRGSSVQKLQPQVTFGDMFDDMVAARKKICHVALEKYRVSDPTEYPERRLVGKNVAHNGYVVIRFEEMIVFEFLENARHHLVAEVPWPVKSGDLRSQPLPDA